MLQAPMLQFKGQAPSAKMESEVDNIVSDLKQRHGQSYSLPKLRMWACVITTGMWEDRDHPPLPTSFW